MSVRFVLGRAGTGKTRRCFNGIVAELSRAPLGPMIYWIVPRQATFQAERELTCASGLAGFSRARVVSFDMLSQDVLAECGGGALPQISAIGRQMILGHLLRQHESKLRFFGKVARQAGLAAKIDAAIAELEHCGKRPEDLHGLIGQIGAAEFAGTVDAAALADKLFDLELIYSAYTQYLGQERIDPRRRMEHFLSCMEGSESLRGSMVWVDGFADFDEFHRRVLARLGKIAASVEIAMMVDPDSPGVRDWTRRCGEDDLSLFHHTEETYRRLMMTLEAEAVVVERPVVLGEVRRFANGVLGEIERAMVEPSRPVSTPALANSMSDKSIRPMLGDAGGIELLEAPDRRGEVDAAARRIRGYLAEGMRYRDIAVVTRRLELYADLISASFREHGIPYFVDRRRGMGHHPLLQFVRAAMSVAIEKWPSDAVMGLCRSGLAGLTLDETDALENYVLLHRLRGSAWDSAEPWAYRRHLTRPSEDATPAPEEVECARMDALRRRVADGVRAFVALASGVQSVRRGTPGTTDPHPNPLPQAGEGTRAPAAPATGGTPVLLSLPRAGEGTGAPALPATGGPPVPPRSDPARSIRQWVTELFALFDRFGVRATLERWIAAARAAGELEEAGEHEQIWRQVVGLFEEMVDLLGEEAVSLADFRTILESGLECFDLALTPPTVDQVLVGQVDRSRTPSVRACIVLGLNDGVFPYAPREASVLSDAERTELRRRNFDVEPDTERRLLDEQLLGYVAFTRASERLYLSRSTNDDAQRELGPSVFWRRVREMWPASPVESVPRDPRGRAELIANPRQLLTAVMRWVREGGKVEDGKAWGSLYQWVARLESARPVSTPALADPMSDRSVRPTGGVSVPPETSGFGFRGSGFGNEVLGLQRLVCRAWGALGYSNLARLSRETVVGLFASPLRLGVGQVEAFAACPFKHFAAYVLGLQEREEADPCALDFDAIYHRVLERIVSQLLQKKRDWATLDSVEMRKLIRFYAQQIGQSLRGELMMSTARNRYLLSRIEKTLDQVIAWQKVVGQRGHFAPGFSHVTFGAEAQSTLPPLVVATPAGREVALCGQIDRVDVLEAESAAAVIDYRLGGGTLDLTRVYHGLALRLLAYLLVLQEHGKKLTKKEIRPAAGLFVRLVRQLGSVKHPEEAADPASPEFHLGCKARGVLEERFVDAFDAEFAGGAAKVVCAYQKKDGSFSTEKNDTADAEQFAAMLRHARQQIAKLGDCILDGQIDISPYRIGTATPCSRCEYKSLCRFEPAVNHYRFINGLSRTEMLERIVAEGQT